MNSLRKLLAVIFLMALSTLSQNSDAVPTYYWHIDDQASPTCAEGTYCKARQRWFNTNAEETLMEWDACQSVQGNTGQSPFCVCTRQFLPNGNPAGDWQCPTSITPDIQQCTNGQQSLPGQLACQGGPTCADFTGKFADYRQSVSHPQGQTPTRPSFICIEGCKVEFVSTKPPNISVGVCLTSNGGGTTCSTGFFGVGRYTGTESTCSTPATPDGTCGTPRDSVVCQTSGQCGGEGQPACETGTTENTGGPTFQSAENAVARLSEDTLKAAEDYRAGREKDNLPNFGASNESERWRLNIWQFLQPDSVSDENCKISETINSPEWKINNWKIGIDWCEYMPWIWAVGYWCMGLMTCFVLYSYAFRSQ
jgi:hypothetical protein